MRSRQRKLWSEEAIAQLECGDHASRPMQRPLNNGRTRVELIGWMKADRSDHVDYAAIPRTAILRPGTLMRTPEPGRIQLDDSRPDGI